MLKNIDPEIYKLLIKEEKRQEDTIDLIASENYVSSAVLRAMGSVLMNKYSEGYSGKRYYRGNNKSNLLYFILNTNYLKEIL